MEIATLGFVGVVVTVLMQYLKKKLRTNKLGNAMLTLAISFIAAVGFKVLSDLGLWESFWAVVVTASMVYNFIVKLLPETK